MVCQRGSDPEGGELDPEIDDRIRCKKNSSVSSSIDGGQKKAATVGAEVGTVHSGRGAEGLIGAKL